jgi:hypothetical protein
MTALAAIIVAVIVIIATEAGGTETPAEQASFAVEGPAPRPPRPHGRGPPLRRRQCRTTRPRTGSVPSVHDQTPIRHTTKSLSVHRTPRRPAHPQRSRPATPR